MTTTTKKKQNSSLERHTSVKETNTTWCLYFQGAVADEADELDAEPVSPSNDGPGFEIPLVFESGLETSLETRDDRECSKKKPRDLCELRLNSRSYPNRT